MQVYAVEIELNGKTETIYVRGDGTLLEEGAGANGNGGTNGNGSQGNG